MERATSLRLTQAVTIIRLRSFNFEVAAQTGREGVSVVVDLGREVSGYPHFAFNKGVGGRVDIGYSERLESDGTVNPNRWGGPPVHYADRVFLRPGLQSFTTLEPRACRYIRLDIYDNPASLDIGVQMLGRGYPVELKGRFDCSDALLNRIWETGRYTTELCMDDAFMDCPWAGARAVSRRSGGGNANCGVCLPAIPNWRGADWRNSRLARTRKAGFPASTPQNRSGNPCCRRSAFSGSSRCGTIFCCPATELCSKKRGPPLTD